MHTFLQEMGWATFREIFSQTHLVTLLFTCFTVLTLGLDVGSIVNEENGDLWPTKFDGIVEAFPRVLTTMGKQIPGVDFMKPFLPKFTDKI
jgi:hypothetical protein